jgi:Tol biopolymer transport system component
MIGTRLGPYEITAKLGEGGMGEVYRATDTKLKREVAIKVLPTAFVADKERLARFEREAQLLAQLHHPNIASIFGLEESEGSRALVMELVEGPTLAERLAQAALPLDESLSIARQIAEALEEAHEKGIVHRDLKPQNIKAPIEGKVKVLDFGLAKAMDPSSGAAAATAGDLARSPTLMNSPTLTAAGTRLGVILGTAAYMSPEQARGGAVDKRADIWAFGVVLWEMLTSHRLFEGETVSDTLAEVLKGEIDFGRLPKSTPAAVRDLLRRCLERNPKNRLRDIGDARIALDERTQSPAEVEPSALPPTASAGAPVRRALRTLAVGLAGLALGLLLATLARPLRSPAGELTAASVVRSEVAPPPGTAFDLRSRGPGPSALSPDGRYLAFGAQAKDAATLLYVRALADGRVTVYPGSEGAQFPFWSPDGRWIAFFSRVDGMLKKVPAAGGTPLSICRSLNGKGGSWGRDDVIVMAPTSGAALHRVSAAGGEPVPVTELAAPYNSHRHPRFLPDGRRFLFLARSSRSEQSTVLLGSLDGAPPREVIRSTTQAELASGHLLFARDSVLLAQTFDLGSGAVTGAAKPIADGVMELRGAAYAAFSASATGRIVLHSGASQALVPLELRDRNGQRLGSVGTPGIYRAPSFSPDGRWIATSGSAQLRDDNSDVWIFDRRSPTVLHFTVGPEEEAETIWAADGRSLFFGSNPKGPHDVFRKSLDGAASAELVYEAAEMQLPTGVSPDGKLLFVESLTGEGAVTEVLDLESGRTRLLRESGFDDSRAVPSPDGRWLAFDSSESGRPEVYVAPFPGLGRTWPVSTGGGRFPAWRADGRELVYASLDGRFVAVPAQPEGDTFHLGAPTELFRSAPPTRDYRDWGMSPDAQLFVVASSGVLEAENELRLIVNWPALLEDR